MIYYYLAMGFMIGWFYSLLVIYLIPKMLQKNTSKTLEQTVIDLHDIARLVEQKIGHGQLSDDIRQTADRLNEVLKEIK